MKLPHNVRAFKAARNSYCFPDPDGFRCIAHKQRQDMTMGEKSQETWIEIARPGRFQDSGGAWHEFTAGRLGDMAAKYDSAGREAPLVLGHPATDGPAHGWVIGSEAALTISRVSPS